MADDGYFFVTRLRKNAVTQVLTPFELPGDSTVLSDEMILIGTTQNCAENVIRPTVIGRKYWLFSVSKAGAKASAICLSLAETSKANGVNFYQYLTKLLTDLPNLPIHQQPDLLHEYMPWSKSIQATCAK